MFKLYANKVNLQRIDKEMVTSGSVNAYDVYFQFSADWDGVTRTAVFKAGDTQISVLLDDGNHCTIPWECMLEARRTLYAGVYGTKGEEVVLPTIWESLGNIEVGATLGNNAQPPTPSIYEQLLAEIGDLSDLETENKDSLVAAINEVYETGGGGSGTPGKDGGYYMPHVDDTGELSWTASEPDMPPVESTNIKGADGEGIPEITAGDEGKVLGVLNGVAVWVYGGGAGNGLSPGIKTNRGSTREEYDALESPDPMTEYLILG